MNVPVSWTLLSEPAPAAAAADAHWDALISRCRSALDGAGAAPRSDADAAPAVDRAYLLALLGNCLRRHPRPDWNGAVGCFEHALTLCAAPDQRAHRGMLLYMFAACLHEQPRPDWARALDACRAALELFREGGDRDGLRAGLYQLGWMLQSRPDPDPAGAAAAYAEAADLARRAADRGETERALLHRAAALEDHLEGGSAPVLDAWRDAAAAACGPAPVLGLIAHLDLAGRHAEADDWAGRLAGRSFAGDVYGSDPMAHALARRRGAWLAVRRGDAAAALELAASASPAIAAAPATDSAGPEARRLLVLAALAHTLRDAPAATGAALEAARPLAPDDRAWARRIAAGVLRRHAPERLPGFLAALD